MDVDMIGTCNRGENFEQNCVQYCDGYNVDVQDDALHIKLKAELIFNNMFWRTSYLEHAIYCTVLHCTILYWSKTIGRKGRLAGSPSPSNNQSSPLAEQIRNRNNKVHNFLLSTKKTKYPLPRQWSRKRANPTASRSRISTRSKSASWKRIASVASKAGRI